MGSYHFYNNTLAIASNLLCRLTRINLTMGITKLPGIFTCDIFNNLWSMLRDFRQAIFTALFSLLPGDCYGDFHPISWRFLRRYLHYYLAVVTAIFTLLAGDSYGAIFIITW